MAHRSCFVTSILHNSTHRKHFSGLCVCVLARPARPERTCLHVLRVYIFTSVYIYSLWPQGSQQRESLENAPPPPYFIFLSLSLSSRYLLQYLMARMQSEKETTQSKALLTEHFTFFLSETQIIPSLPNLFDCSCSH